MTRGAKRINPNCRGKIETVKNAMRYASAPFDGDGYIFRQALKEVRKEGAPIIYDPKNCRYYNRKTISPNWGY
jgi:hypothetical protein